MWGSPKDLGVMYYIAKINTGFPPDLGVPPICRVVGGGLYKPLDSSSFKRKPIS